MQWIPVVIGSYPLAARHPAVVPKAAPMAEPGDEQESGHSQDMSGFSRDSFLSSKVLSPQTLNLWIPPLFETLSEDQHHPPPLPSSRPESQTPRGRE